MGVEQGSINGIWEESEITVFHKVYESIYCISYECCAHLVYAHAKNVQLRQTIVKQSQITGVSNNVASKLTFSIELYEQFLT